MEWEKIYLAPGRGAVTYVYTGNDEDAPSRAFRLARDSMNVSWSFRCVTSVLRLELPGLQAYFLIVAEATIHKVKRYCNLRRLCP